MPIFEIGRIYNRRNDIHGVYGGQMQGGISTPKDHPSVLIFTASAGLKHGYEDRYQEDGLFWYYGEGQHGDMELNKGNLAIASHEETNKELHLFEYVGTGQVRYVSECRCLNFHIEQAPDREGQSRNAIVFELELLAGGEASISPDTADPKWSMSEDELYSLALRSSSSKQVKERKVNVYKRSQAVRLFALKRAAGICQACRNPAPFEDKKGKPFLEVHHLYRVTDGGPDHPDNVVAICPNCHRSIHQGRDGTRLNETLIESQSQDRRNS